MKNEALDLDIIKFPLFKECFMLSFDLDIIKFPLFKECFMLSFVEIGQEA